MIRVAAMADRAVSAVAAPHATKRPVGVHPSVSLALALPLLLPLAVGRLALFGLGMRAPYTMALSYIYTSLLRPRTKLARYLTALRKLYARSVQAVAMATCSHGGGGSPMSTNEVSGLFIRAP
jgi:hypothetical protein